MPQVVLTHESAFKKKSSSSVNSLRKWRSWSQVGENWRQQYFSVTRLIHQRLQDNWNNVSDLRFSSRLEDCRHSRSLMNDSAGVTVRRTDDESSQLTEAVGAEAAEAKKEVKIFQSFSADVERWLHNAAATERAQLHHGSLCNRLNLKPNFSPNESQEPVCDSDSLADGWWGWCWWWWWWYGWIITQRLSTMILHTEVSLRGSELHKCWQVAV